MRGQQSIKDAADLVQVGHIVGKPGDEPTQGKEGRDTTLLDVTVELRIALQSAQPLNRCKPKLAISKGALQKFSR